MYILSHLCKTGQNSVGQVEIKVYLPYLKVPSKVNIEPWDGSLQHSLTMRDVISGK